MEWITKEDDRNFWIEARFLTNWGAQRELRKSSFVHSDFIRSPDVISGSKHYIRYWPDGIHAVARIHPKMDTGRVKVTVSYYNNKGQKFRKLPVTSN